MQNNGLDQEEVMKEDQVLLQENLNKYLNSLLMRSHPVVCEGGVRPGLKGLGSLLSSGESSVFSLHSSTRSSPSSSPGALPPSGL